MKIRILWKTTGKACYFMDSTLLTIYSKQYLHIVEFQGTEYDNTKKNIVVKCLEPLVIGKSSGSHAGVCHLEVPYLHQSFFSFHLDQLETPQYFY